MHKAAAGFVVGGWWVGGAVRWWGQLGMAQGCCCWLCGWWCCEVVWAARHGTRLVPGSVGWGVCVCVCGRGAGASRVALHPNPKPFLFSSPTPHTPYPPFQTNPAKGSKKAAPAENRTRVCTVARYYSTTKPPAHCVLNWGFPCIMTQEDQKTILPEFRLFCCAFHAYLRLATLGKAGRRRGRERAARGSPQSAPEGAACCLQFSIGSGLTNASCPDSVVAKLSPLIGESASR